MANDTGSRTEGASGAAEPKATPAEHAGINLELEIETHQAERASRECWPEDAPRGEPGVDCNIQPDRRGVVTHSRLNAPGAAAPSLLEPAWAEGTSVNAAGRDWWLLVAGLIYPVGTFWLLLCCGGRMGPLGWHPLVIPLPALVLAVTAIALARGGARIHWLSVAVFIAWLFLIVYAQWSVWAQACASV